MPTQRYMLATHPEFTELHSRPHDPRAGTVALTLEGSIQLHKAMSPSGPSPQLHRWVPSRPQAAYAPLNKESSLGGTVQVTPGASGRQGYLPLPCAWMRLSAALCPSPLLLRDPERQGRGSSTLAVEH